MYIDLVKLLNVYVNVIKVKKSKQFSKNVSTRRHLLTFLMFVIMNCHLSSLNNMGLQII